MSKPPGRMMVNLRLQGGEAAFVDAMRGMVHRNERAIREGKVPMPDQAKGVKFVHEDVWRDAPNALIAGRASAGSMAAWIAAARRVKGEPATLVYSGGVPGILCDGSVVHPGHIKWFGPDPEKFPRGLVGALDDSVGRVREWLDLTIDDPLGLPIREIGDGIAAHNAKQILKRDLPELYKSGIVYKVEGSPEKWKDYAEALDDGEDDCEGLGAIRAGEILARHDRPAMVWTRDVSTARPTGFPGQGSGRLFHALTAVVQSDGSLQFDDPSVRLGMEVPDWFLDYARKQRSRGLGLDEPSQPQKRGAIPLQGGLIRLT